MIYKEAGIFLGWMGFGGILFDAEKRGEGEEGLMGGWDGFRRGGFDDSVLALFFNGFCIMDLGICIISSPWNPR